MDKNDRESMSEPVPVVRGPAWLAAEAAGFDMALIESSLAKTPSERIFEHDAALALADKLRTAGEAYHAKSKRPIAKAD
jgi:hypothetical protein